MKERKEKNYRRKYENDLDSHVIFILDIIMSNVENDQ